MDITAGSLNISKAEKQELLETLDVKERLRRVLSLINRELEILELGKKIQTQVKVEMDKAQKEYYLWEHIKVLQRDRAGRSKSSSFAWKRRGPAPRHEGGGAGMDPAPPTSPDHQVIRPWSG